MGYPDPAPGRRGWLGARRIMSIIEIHHPFAPVTITRKGTPRSTKSDVRAKLVHTASNGRCIVVFVTAAVLARLDWKAGGLVRAAFSSTDKNLRLRFTPSHAGLKIASHSRKTTTCRIHVSGDFIARSACAAVRSVPFEAMDGALLVNLPLPWAASDGRGIADAPAGEQAA